MAVTVLVSMLGMASVGFMLRFYVAIHREHNRRTCHEVHILHTATDSDIEVEVKPLAVLPRREPHSGQRHCEPVERDWQ